MRYEKDRAWLEISMDAIRENYERITKAIGPDRRIIAVLKANAYGLGAVPIAKALEALGCPMFATACIEEAMELRENRLTPDILTLGPVVPRYAALCAENNILQPVISLSQAHELSRAAGEQGVTLRVHLKTDVGLGRFGLWLGSFEQALKEAKEIFALPHLKVEGVFTHYTGADLPVGEEFNRRQIDLFHHFCDALKAEGLSFACHSASSLFTEIYPEAYDDYVRTAALLLGLEGPASRGITCVPSASFKARIYQIKELPMGVPISYGPLFYTLRPTRIAVLPLGFADGLRRNIAGRVSFLLHGRRVPILGKVCMDYLMLDVTDFPEAQEGDIVTVFGRDGDLHQEAWELAEQYPGSVGEVTSVLVSRIPRFYTGEVPCAEKSL